MSLCAGQRTYELINVSLILAVKKSLLSANKRLQKVKIESVTIFITNSDFPSNFPE